ncbi:MAG: MFS transporter, partial [Elioraea sp.]|nr:MFS transporter [Elioraea sp.]
MEGTPKTMVTAEAASLAVPAVPFALLAAVAGIGQVAANMPLPSLPAIAASYSIGAAELVIAVFLAAFAPAQLVWGPLSDRYGRRPVVLWALGVFAAGSVVCAVAPSFAVLLAGRVLQAAGGAAGLVIARACLRDGREESSLGRGMAGLSMAIAAVPAFAPLIGALLEQAWSWRAGFWLSSVLGALVVAWGLAR